ncbi:MAG: DUF2470 domain-containing protein [Planctomycetota bacterium]
MSAPEPSAEEAFIRDAQQFLRSHLAGTIRFDDEHVAIKVVVAPDGTLVAPVMVAMIRALDVALFLPDEDAESMHLQLTLEEIRDSGDDAALCDRWRIYHGEPEDVRWARLSIDCARFGGNMLDGLALMQPNPLAKDEARLCREANGAKRDALRKAAARAAGMDIEDPRLVGVDPLGFDVRGRFEVHRIPVEPPLVDADDAIEALEELAAG